MNRQRSAAWLVGMVTLSVFINYIDRGNLSTASSLIADQLHLDEAQLGVLFSAFYFGYVPLMPFMGMLADRIGAKLVLATGVAIWSIATFSTGLAGGFMSLLALRVLLGIGESAAFPCASKIIAQSVPVARLGLANGILSCGYLVGPSVGMFLGGTLMIFFGWRVVFMVFGAASLLWLWPWRRADISTSTGGEATPGETASVPSFWRILRERSLWGAAIGHFASNYTYYFILSWLPYYLVKSRDFSLQAMVETASLAYAVNAASALAMGWLADRWIREGGSPTRIYKWIMAANHVAGFICIGAIPFLGAPAAIAALFVFQIASGASYPGLFAIPQIIAGPAATARWVGVQNACGNAAGLVAPILGGWLAHVSGSFNSAFAVAAGVNLAGLVGWVWIMQKVEPRDWGAGDMASSPARASS